jgi:hypothetical protein
MQRDVHFEVDAHARFVRACRCSTGLRPTASQSAIPIFCLQRISRKSGSDLAAMTAASSYLLTTLICPTGPHIARRHHVGRPGLAPRGAEAGAPDRQLGS